MKLLVNAPTGKQEIIEVGEGGGYFDETRVVWDERTDGPLPQITLGGMVRSGSALVYSQQRMDEQIASQLAPAKTAKNTQINQWRADANQTSFPHAGKQVACDALSRSDIDAVANSIALTGAFPAGFPGAWKAVDNSYIMLPNVDAFKALHASMTAQGTINFGHSQDLKAALAAATDVGAVNAIVW